MTADLTVTSSVTLTHRIVFTAPEGSHVVVRVGSDSTAAFKQVIAEVVADSDGNAQVLKTSVTGSGYAVREDGTMTGSRRNLTVSNINRLPTFLREAIEAAAEGLGVVGLAEDAARLRGMSKSYGDRHDVSQETVGG